MSRRSSTAQLKQASEPKYLKEITVIDPTSRYGKLYVPVHLTYDTKGRTEWFTCQGQLPKDLSICCLFQKGKCHVGERCFQVHIDRAWVADSRRKYADLITCCHGCGDVHSNSDSHRRAISKHFPTGIAVISFGGGSDVELEVEASRLANTDGLVDTFRQRVAKRRDGAPILGFNKVCRLHLKNNCKYGKDCKNLHVCHKLADIVLSEESKAVANKKQKGFKQPAAAVHEAVRLAKRPVTPPPPSIECMSHAGSDGSLCATPEVRSRTSSPPSAINSRRNSMTDSPPSAIRSTEKFILEPVDFVNGFPVSPPKSRVEDVAFNFDALSRFQCQWNSRVEFPEEQTESLQIIFSGLTLF